MTESVERIELLTDPSRQALAGLFDTALPDGDEILPMWHLVYLLDHAPQADLGPDGHPTHGSVPTPPGPGLRRMFAGGRVNATAPLRIGATAARRSQTINSTQKQGRTGLLTFVTVRHEYRQHDQLVLAEEQDFAYRDAVDSPAAPNDSVGADTQPVQPTERQFTIDPTVLFRFSALTYNAHRIHYDRDFATRQEGYPGLLVHGPLQAVLMAEQARRLSAFDTGPYRYEYRLAAPLFDHQGLVIGAKQNADGITTYVRDHTGRITATGSVHFG